jgi:hypothetical protein
MMRVRIEASENLGTESYAFFVVDAPAIESDASASGSASFTEESRLLAEGANTCLFVAVLPIAKMPSVGDEVLLAAPLDRLHLFDPSGGAALARDASLG